METFKTLTYCGYYIDATRLHSGIYSQAIPTLHSNGATIQSLLESYKANCQICNQKPSKEYIDNLLLCEMSEVTVGKKDSSDAPLTLFIVERRNMKGETEDSDCFISRKYTSAIDWIQNNLDFAPDEQYYWVIIEQQEDFELFGELHSIFDMNGKLLDEQPIH